MVGTEPRHTSSHAETSPRRGDPIRPPGSAIVDHAEVRAGGQPFGVASLKPARDQWNVWAGAKATADTGRPAWDAVTLRQTAEDDRCSWRPRTDWSARQAKRAILCIGTPRSPAGRLTRSDRRRTIAGW